MLIRQGDVLLRRIKKLPADVVRDETPGDVIVEHGEVTGHAHRIGMNASMFRDAGGGRGQYIVVGDAPAQMTHEEHSTATLEAGAVYERLPQSEYSPQAIRRVVD